MNAYKNINHNTEKVTYINSNCLFSPPFPQFTELKMDGQINLQNHNIDINDINDISNVQLNDNVISMPNYTSTLDDINYDEMYDNLSLFKFLTKNINLISVEDMDFVTKIIYIIKNDVYNKRMATLKLKSNISLRGETVYWNAELRFTKPEWNYFISICNLDVLENLEQTKKIKYTTIMNTIYFNSDLYNSVEEFIKSLYISS